MLVAAGQFAVSPVWERNAETCVSLMEQAAESDVSLLVLPEALLARDDLDPDLAVKSAQPVEGDFLARLLRESKRNTMTTVAGDTCTFSSWQGVQYAGRAAKRKNYCPVCQVASL